MTPTVGKPRRQLESPRPRFPEPRLVTSGRGLARERAGDITSAETFAWSTPVERKAVRRQARRPSRTSRQCGRVVRSLHRAPTPAVDRRFGRAQVVITTADARAD